MLPQRVQTVGLSFPSSCLPPPVDLFFPLKVRFGVRTRRTLFTNVSRHELIFVFFLSFPLLRFLPGSILKL